MTKLYVLGLIGLVNYGVVHLQATPLGWARRLTSFIWPLTFVSAAIGLMLWRDVIALALRPDLVFHQAEYAQKALYHQVVGWTVRVLLILGSATLAVSVAPFIRPSTTRTKYWSGVALLLASIVLLGVKLVPWLLRGGLFLGGCLAVERLLGNARRPVDEVDGDVFD